MRVTGQHQCHRRHWWVPRVARVNTRHTGVMDDEDTESSTSVRDSVSAGPDFTVNVVTRVPGESRLTVEPVDIKDFGAHGWLKNCAPPWPHQRSTGGARGTAPSQHRAHPEMPQYAAQRQPPNGQQPCRLHLSRARTRGNASTLPALCRGRISDETRHVTAHTRTYAQHTLTLLDASAPYPRGVVDGQHARA